METKKVRSSMTLVLIMVMSLFATLEFSDRAEGSEIVVTDAIQVVASGTLTTEWLPWMLILWATLTLFGVEILSICTTKCSTPEAKS